MSTAKNTEKIWVILDGKDAKFGRIEVLTLSSILINFQKFIFDYGKAVNVKKKEYLKLYLTKVGEGSVEVQLKPHSALHPIPFKAIEFLGEFSDCLNGTNNAKALLFSEFKQNKDLIIKSLKEIEAFWSRDDLTISIGIGREKPKKLIRLDPKKREKIHKLINMYLKQYSQSLNGVILKLKLYGNRRYFEILTPSGERVKCYYNHIENPDLEDSIIENSKKPVKVIGFVKEKGTEKIVENVVEVRTWNKFKLTKEFAGYKLKKEIPLEIEYDNYDNLWCLQNIELELYGCGETFKEALENLKIVFEVLIEEYALESEDILSDKAIELKKKILEYVEVKK